MVASLLITQELPPSLTAFAPGSTAHRAAPAIPGTSPNQGSHHFHSVFPEPGFAWIEPPPRDPLKIRCSPPDSLTGISLKSSRGSSSPSHSYFPPLTVRGRGSSHRPWRSAATSPTWRFGQAVPADDRSCGKGAELGHLSLAPFFMAPVGWLVRCLPRGSGSGRRTSHPRSWHSFRRRRRLRLQRTACPRPPSTSSGRGSRRRSLWRPL